MDIFKEAEMEIEERLEAIKLIDQQAVIKT